MQRTPSKAPDPVMACLAADGFFRQATAFFEQLPKDLNQAGRFVYERRGDLVAAVTSLALSVELYLKALGMASSKTPKKTHDLLQLFDHLPQRLRADIESTYSSAVTLVPAGSLDAVEVVITTTPVPPTPAECAAAQPRDLTTVRGVLEAEKSAFRGWRYLHESELPSGFAIFRTDFHRVSLIAKILQQHLRSGSGSPSG